MYIDNVLTHSHTHTHSANSYKMRWFCWRINYAYVCSICMYYDRKPSKTKSIKSIRVSFVTWWNWWSKRVWRTLLVAANSISPMLNHTAAACLSVSFQHAEQDLGENENYWWTIDASSAPWMFDCRLLVRDWRTKCPLPLCWYYSIQPHWVWLLERASIVAIEKQKERKLKAIKHWSLTRKNINSKKNAIQNDF